VFPLAPGEEGDGQQQLRVQKGVVIVEGVGEEPAKVVSFPGKWGRERRTGKPRYLLLSPFLKETRPPGKGDLEKGHVLLKLSDLQISIGGNLQ